MYDVTSGFRVFGDISKTIRRRDFRLPKLDSSLNSGSDRMGPISVRDRFFAMTSYISVTFLSDIENGNFHRIALKFLLWVDISTQNAHFKFQDDRTKIEFSTNV